MGAIIIICGAARAAPPRAPTTSNGGRGTGVIWRERLQLFGRGSSDGCRGCARLKDIPVGNWLIVCADSSSARTLKLFRGARALASRQKMPADRMSLQ